MTDEISDEMSARRSHAIDLQIIQGHGLDIDLFLKRCVAINRAAMAVKERLHRLMHCPKCIVEHPVPYKHLEFTFLYSTFEEDPLRNFWKLVTNACSHCGYEETLALDAPDPQVRRPRTPNGLDPGHSLNRDVWEAYRSEYEEQQKRRQAKQASMAALYGGVSSQPGSFDAILAARRLFDEIEAEKNMNTALRAQLTPALRAQGDTVTTYEGVEISEASILSKLKDR